MRGGPEAEGLGKAWGWMGSSKGDVRMQQCCPSQEHPALTSRAQWTSCCVHASCNCILLGASASRVLSHRGRKSGSERLSNLPGLHREDLNKIWTHIV